MIILINVFTVDPANQHRLLELLARATDEFVSRAPGFVSSTLHRSLDGTKVTMYAQWRSTKGDWTDYSFRLGRMLRRGFKR
jgi:quinol monooxygenase YgiN